MPHWNHRVVKQKELEEDVYSMSEVFYDKEEKPWLYSTLFCADSLEGLRLELQRMLSALDKPVLDEIEFNPELQKEAAMQEVWRGNEKPVVNFTGSAEVNFLDRSIISGVLNHPVLGDYPWVSTSKTIGAKADAEGEVYEVETLNTIYRKVKNA